LLFEIRNRKFYIHSRFLGNNSGKINLKIPSQCFSNEILSFDWVLWNSVYIWSLCSEVSRKIYDPKHRSLKRGRSRLMLFGSTRGDSQAKSMEYKNFRLSCAFGVFRYIVFSVVEVSKFLSSRKESKSRGSRQYLVRSNYHWPNCVIQSSWSNLTVFWGEKGEETCNLLSFVLLVEPKMAGNQSKRRCSVFWKCIPVPIYVVGELSKFFHQDIHQKGPGDLK